MEVLNKKTNINTEMEELQKVEGRDAVSSDLMESSEVTGGEMAEASDMVSLRMSEAGDSPAVADEVFTTPGRGIDSSEKGSTDAGSLIQAMNLRYEKDSLRNSDEKMDVQWSRSKRKTRLFSDEDDEEEIVSRSTRSKRLNSGEDIVDLTTTEDPVLSVSQFIDLDNSLNRTGDKKLDTCRKRKKRDPKRSIEEQLDALPADQEVLKNLSASQLRDDALTWLDEIDMIRRGCKNIKGSFSKWIKNKVTIAQEVINILADREEDKGDPGSLKKKNFELVAENASYKKEIASLRRDLDSMQKVVESLQVTIATEQAARKTLVDKTTSPDNNAANQEIPEITQQEKRQSLISEPLIQGKSCRIQEKDYSDYGDMVVVPETEEVGGLPQRTPRRQYGMLRNQEVRTFNRKESEDAPSIGPSNQSKRSRCSE